MELEKEKNLKEKADEAYEFIQKVKTGQIKSRQLKVPRKAKVRRGRIKKGYLGIIKVDENGNLSGEKQRIVGSAFQLKEGTFHATDGREIAFWNGKFPVIIQPTWKLNPINLRLKEGDSDETYGQSYVMAKMLSTGLKEKKKIGMGWIIWVLIAIGAYIGYMLITQGHL